LNFKLKYFLYSFVIFTTLSFGFYTLTNNNSVMRIQSILDKHTNSLKIHYDIFLYNQQRLADQIHQQTILDPVFVSIFSQAYKYKNKPEKLNKIRHALKLHLDKAYAIYKKNDLLQFQFIFSDNSSFLRMHKPNKYGDNLSKAREDFVHVNKTKTPVHGFTQGRTAHAFRNDYPLYDKNGIHIGAMEVSFPTELLQHYLNKISTLHSHFLVHKNVFTTKAWKRDDLILNYRQSIEHPNFMVTMPKEHISKKCYNDIPNKIKDITNDIDINMRKGEMFSKYLREDKESKIISFLPVKHAISKENVAWIVAYDNNNMINIIQKNLFIYRISFTLILLVTLFVIYRFILQRVVLASAETKFKTIFNTSLDGILLIDPRTNRFLEFNTNAHKMLGYTKEEFAKLTISDLDANNNTIELNENASYKYTTRYKAKDATIKDVDITILPLKLTDKKLLQATFHDITTQKTLEKRLKNEKIKAVNATKVKSNFLANMSHEIRTPMNGIIGISYLLLKTHLSSKQQDYLQKIDNSAKSLLGIINDILDISKIEAGKLTIEKSKFNLKTVVDNLVNIIKIQADQKNLSIVLNSSLNENTNFYGDSLRLSQILTNLMANAVKFTEKGSIELSIKQISHNRVYFELSDTGIGLSKKQQEKLFQSFSQADSSTTRKYGGTGLGLTISKQLIELMNGEINLKSELGVGSTFSFEIDLQESKEEQNIPLKKCEQENNTVQTFNQENVLIVEDNKTNQIVLLGLLEGSNLNIEIANNGQQAVDKFSHNRSKYQLILMDIQMPILDGYEATKKIRELDPNVPIVALSANVMKEDIEKSLSAGMNDHIGKPINLTILFNLLAKYLGSPAQV